jgi:putative PIN family toxin of toxin-antitoxin system
MIDANILVSAIMFNSRHMDALFQEIFDHHTLVICSYTVDEVLDVAKRKFPGSLAAVDYTFASMPYEFVYSPTEIRQDLFQVRDPDDYPVIYTAITEDIDILISGDKDLLSVELDKPEILSPAEFLEKYR